MRLDEHGGLILAPTDLGNHLGCAHATTLALAAARGEGPKASQGGRYEQLIARKGEEHEADYLRALQGARRDVRHIPTDIPVGDAAAMTERAMRAGVDVIYQATFAFDGWSGRADFLERVEVGTALGMWGYEAVDTKLARHEAAPRHVLQLAIYTAAIEGLQGTEPHHMHLQLGSGRRETLRVRDFAAYVRRAQRSLRAFTHTPTVTEPYPCAHCQFCGFRRVCESWWDECDHLSRVAGIRRADVDGLSGGGLATLAALSELPAGRDVGDLAPDRLDELRWQASMQLRSRRSGTLQYDMRPLQEGRGLARLPQPSDGDLFLDFEGDPVWSAAQELIFLFGILERDGGDWSYRAWWGHDPAEQIGAFEQVVDHVVARRLDHPGMHVYHYSAAEPSAFRRLAELGITREAEIDSLLRDQVFCDLLPVTKQALVLGAPGYGLKEAEKLASFTRSADVGSGTDAVLAYEAWIEGGRVDGSLLRRIADYNEEDVRATRALRDWLVAQRPQGLAWWTNDGGEQAPRPVSDAELARREVRERLAVDAEPFQMFVADLMGYHWREARPVWWFWFDRQTMTPLELRRDREAVAGLTPHARGTQPHTKQSDRYWLAYPPQDHKIGIASNYTDPATLKGVNVVALEDELGLIAIARTKKRAGEPLPEAIIPGGPIGTDAQKDALARLGRSVLDGAERYSAVMGMLRREPPRLRDRPAGALLQTEDPDEQIALARALDRSHLVVQGPPGTGKTYLGGRLICALLADGRRVGVMSGSHKAVNNLLDSVVSAAVERSLTFRGARKTSAAAMTACTPAPT